MKCNFKRQLTHYMCAVNVECNLLTARKFEPVSGEPSVCALCNVHADAYMQVQWKTFIVSLN